MGAAEEGIAVTTYIGLMTKISYWTTHLILSLDEESARMALLHLFINIAEVKPSLLTYFSCKADWYDRNVVTFITTV